MAGVGMQYAVDYEWSGPKVAGAVKTSARLGTRRAAVRLLALSVPRAPKRDGILRSSGTVKGVNAEPVSFVVFDTPYAVRQHEELDWVHREGESKYLEKPMEESHDELMGIIAKEIRIGILNA